jgi:hypothetical protein
MLVVDEIGLHVDNASGEIEYSLLNWLILMERFRAERFTFTTMVRF